MTKDTLTHKDLAAIAGVSETTIKSYRRKFGNFIPVVTHGKPLRFKPETREVCLRIRELFVEGLSVGEIRTRLKTEFKEYKPKPVKKPASPVGATGGGGMSGEDMETISRSANQVIQGMVQLATAQARTDQRLARLEKGMKELVEIERLNSEHLAELVNLMAEGMGGKLRAKKVIKIKGDDGQEESYTFEADKEASKPDEEKIVPEKERIAEPPLAFFHLPVVIRSERGEFLGVPGKMSIKEFTNVLASNTPDGTAKDQFWYRAGAVWVFSMEFAGGKKHELYFEGTRTPRGNMVALLVRLAVDEEETSHQFLTEFFRQVKDWI
ncbi:MAG: MerR family transcriptional regulator [Desulfovibrio sp.]